MSVQLVEFYSEHWYRRIKDGEVVYYPSITTKMGVVRKPFLETWRGDLGNRECDMRLFEAQERGSRIHHAWYTLTQGGAVIYNNWKRPAYLPEEIGALIEKYDGKVAVMKYQDEQLDVWKLQRFMEIVKPKVVASEITLYSDKYGEAGTADNLFFIEGGSFALGGREAVSLETGLYIADLKTGHVFSDDAYLQMAAYANMYSEMEGKDIQGTIGLHTGASTKTGIEGFKVYPRTKKEMAADFKNFRHVAEVWASKNKESKPRVFDFPALITLNNKGEK